MREASVRFYRSLNEPWKRDNGAFPRRSNAKQEAAEQRAPEGPDPLGRRRFKALVSAHSQPAAVLVRIGGA